MERDDDAGILFARLTCLLEDAAGLAGEGQNPRLTPSIRRELLLQIRLLMTEAQFTAQSLSERLEDR